MAKSVTSYTNSVSSATKRAPNKVAYGFIPNRPIDLAMNASTTPESEQLRLVQVRKDAKDAIDFANMGYKYQYDRLHQPLFLRVNDLVLLRLHKGYTIPSTVGITTKVAQQFVGPFRVIEKIGRLAYKLRIPSHWKIRPVSTIAQLEPYISGDPYE